MTMIVINIYEAKAKLSEYVEAAGRGEKVLICNRNRPVAELRAIPSARVTPRPIGGAKATFTVPSSFFDPLPDDELEAWTGGDASAGARAARVAERPDASYSAPRRGSRRKGAR